MCLYFRVSTQPLIDRISGILTLWIILTYVPLHTHGKITRGGVNLIPSGALQMTASWVDDPNEGAVGVTYNFIILTTYRSPPSSEAHFKSGLTRDNLAYDPDTHTYSLIIDASNANQFGPGNTVTERNFPGWQMGVDYRIYIEYYNSTDIDTRSKLNIGAEMTQYFATPMQLASPPLAVTMCGLTETAVPCHEIVQTDNSIRVHWEKPDTRGYADYIPTPAYLIDHYEIEVSECSDFRSLLRPPQRCLVDQDDDYCDFNERIANIKDLEANHIYFLRISASTIIGSGEKSDIITTVHIPGVISTVASEPVCNCGENFYASNRSIWNTCSRCPLFTNSKDGSIKLEDCKCDVSMGYKAGSVPCELMEAHYETEIEEGSLWWVGGAILLLYICGCGAQRKFT